MMNLISKNKTLVLTVLGVLITAVLIWAIFNRMPGSSVTAGEVTIKAAKSTPYGIDTDTNFEIAFKEPIDERTVKEGLTATPAFAYDLKKEKRGTVYRIIPRNELAANTVYKLAFDPEHKQLESMSWAFQTVGSFRVINTLPRDLFVGVPIDSGIEITFSHESFDLEQARKLFKISPQVDGRFEKHKRTLVFIPKKLEPSTLYTVTLDKGLVGLNNQTIEESLVFRFETASATKNDQEFNFFLDNRITEFSSQQAPAFPVSLTDGVSIPQVNLSLYRFSDGDSYNEALQRFIKIPMWVNASEAQFRVNVSGLTAIADYNTEFKKAGPYKYLVTLPERMAAGYYALDIKAGKQTRQVIFQVSDLAVYRAQGKQQTMLWVNDLITKQPVPGVQVWAGSKKVGTGDDKGVILLDKDLESTNSLLLKAGNKQLLVPLDSTEGLRGPAVEIREQFWKYLYLDRELYLPGDTVHFWGVLTPRGSMKPEADKFSLQLWGGDYYYTEERSELPLYQQKLQVSGNTFSGAMKLPMLKPGYYYLDLRYGDASLISRGFSVETYQKPAYQLTVSPDKKAIIAGEKVNYLIKSTFFEGTPLPQLKVNYYLNNREAQVTTNLQGEATVSYTGTYAADNFSSFSYEYFNVNASTPESGDIGDYNGVMVFPSAVSVRAKAKTEGSIYELTAFLNQIDLSQVDKDGYVTEENYLRAPINGGKIQAKLYKEVWTRTQTGESYDYINKKVIPLYNYQFHTQLVDTFVLTTDQNGQAHYQGNIDKGYSYYLELTSPDSQGRLGRSRVYVGEFYDDLYSYNYYSLRDMQSKSYVPGDQVKLEIMKNSHQLQSANTMVLFFQGQNRIENYRVQNDPVYQFKFEEKDIPNTNVYGVYFDGESYQETGNYIVAFDRQSRNLQVSVTSDKKEYRPGDTVKLKVTVKDRNQRAVKNARINLNLVDEALYRLMDQQVDILGGLYGDYIWPSLITWKSHYHPQLGGGAEQGGEGPGERKDFRDTVLFKELITDGQGKAEVTFKLPDNLTSWRVTYHAVTESLEASSGISKLPVRLPFFISVNVNQDYQVGDQPVIIVRSYGSKLQSNQSVSYQMEITDPQGQQSQIKGSGKAFSAYDFSLPALQKGKYTIKVIGTSGNLKDTIVQSFQVTNQVIKRQTVTQQVLKNNSITAINTNSQEPVTLIFSDYEKSINLKGLLQLSWLCGSRVENRVASQQANTLLRQYFPDSPRIDLQTTASIINYQQKDGGIGILPYGSSDLEISARIAALAPDLFDRRALKGYFYRLLDEDQTANQSLIWLGLASLNEPVLLDVKQALENSKLSAEEQINLNLALLELGDGAQAEKLYKRLLEQYGQNMGTSIRINVGRDQDEVIKATSQLALLAARLNQPEKEQLLAYLLDNQGKEVVNSLEMLQILKYNLRYMDNKEVSFKYELNGQVSSHTLKDEQTVKLTLTPENLVKLRIKDTKGRVGVMMYQSEEIGAATGISEGLAITRNYYVGSKAVSEFKRNDLVKVVIKTQMTGKSPGGTYEVLDVLPAGLAYLARPYQPYQNLKDLPNWPTEVNGRQLTFAVSKGRDTITYYARVVAPGKYRAEAPLLQHSQNSKVFVQGNQQDLTIK